MVADSAYAGGELKKLPPGITWTTRLRKDAALHGLPPARTGRRGRPRVKGDRLPSLARLAADAEFAPVTVTWCGKAATIEAAAVTCLWPSVFGTRPVTVVLIRDKSATGYALGLVTPDAAASPAQVIHRYAARWSIEVAIEDSKQIFGAGQARNRTAAAVERTIPFQLACQAIATTWYATAGHDPAGVADHRARASWYTTKSQPSTADMLGKLRRVSLALLGPGPTPGPYAHRMERSAHNFPMRQPGSQQKNRLAASTIATGRPTDIGSTPGRSPRPEVSLFGVQTADFGGD